MVSFNDNVNCYDLTYISSVTYEHGAWNNAECSWREKIKYSEEEASHCHVQNKHHVDLRDLRFRPPNNPEDGIILNYTD